MTAADVKRVLLLGADAGFLALLQDQLERDGDFAASTAASPDQALEIAARTDFDIALVDAGPSGRADSDSCRLLRQGGLAAPVIMLGGDGGAEAAIASGADDHIAKPLRIAALLSRMRLRLQYRAGGRTLAIGPYEFRPETRSLVEAGSGRRTHLTEKEAAILDFLYRARDRFATRETLLAEVWGHPADLATHTLETHVYRLRQKIEPDPANAALLVTHRDGYRLVP